jgi:hypothetical protein
MQITPAPPPIVPNPSPQDMAAKTAAPVLAQATTPVTQRAVDPTSKSDRGQKTRSNGERAKGGGKEGAGDEERGHSVNIKV